MATVRFSITGEFITNHFRNLVLEGKWSRALADLKESMIGMNDMHAGLILSGLGSLRGEDEEIYLDMNEDSEYRKELFENFSKYYFYQSEVYLPKAIIETIKQEHEHVYNRANFYMDFDLIKFINDECVLFKKVDLNSIPSFIYRELKDNQCFSLWDVDYIVSDMINDSKDGRTIVFDMLKKKRLPGELIESDFIKEEIYFIDSLRESIHYSNRQKYMSELRQKVLDKNNGEFFIFKGQKHTYEVPKRPLLKWAKQDVEWEATAPSSIKMRNDNPVHTDMCLGTSLIKADGSKIPFDIDKAYDNKEFTNFIYDFLILNEGLSDFEFITFNGQGLISGYVHFYEEGMDTTDKIIVIPDGGIEYFEAAKKAKLVISAKGGQMSHLAVNALQYNINYILFKDAHSMLSNNNFEFHFDLDNGNLTIGNQGEIKNED